MILMKKRAEHVSAFVFISAEKQPARHPPTPHK